LRYQLHGRAHWMGLGSAREFSLKEVRERANAERQKLSDKTDPLQLRRAERAAKAATAATVKTSRNAPKPISRRIGPNGNPPSMASNG